MSALVPASLAGRVSPPVPGWCRASKRGLGAVTDVLRMATVPFGVKVVLIKRCSGSGAGRGHAPADQAAAGRAGRTCQAGAMQPAQPSAQPTQPYDERLTVPRSWWFIPIGTGIALGLILLPFGTLPMLVGLVGGGVLAAAAANSYGAARIRVVAGSLVAGEARIPVAALGEATVLDSEEAVAWRRHKADPRAFMLLRSYVPTALKVQIIDPEDPTPYVYLSTRTPQRLMAALDAVKTR